VQGSVNVGGLVGKSDHQRSLQLLLAGRGHRLEPKGGFCGLNGWNTGAHMYRSYSTGL
jgi:hypothetical protein